MFFLPTKKIVKNDVSFIVIRSVLRLVFVSFTVLHLSMFRISLYHFSCTLEIVLFKHIKEINVK